jgi:hypothetical protein
MSHFLGRALFILGFLILWPLQIGLGVFAIYYIVKAFLDAGVIAALISIPIAGLCLWGIHMLLGLIEIPLAGLTASLLEDKEEKVNPYEKEWREAMEAQDLEFQKEKAHIREQLKKSYMNLGMTSEEADKKVADDEREIDNNLRLEESEKP